MASALKIYNHTICPYAQRAMITLKELKLDYEVVEIDPGNQPAWYKEKVNPQNKIPALDVGNNTILIESLVISEYLAEVHKDKAQLLPADPLEKAKLKIFIENFGNTVTPLFYRAVRGTDEEAPAIIESFINSLKGVNNQLLTQSKEGPYYLGSQFSLADVALAPFVGRFFLLEALKGGSIPNTPELARFHQWKEALIDRQSFKDTFAEKQWFIDEFTRRFNIKK
eukprot:TRINITY_DN1999_c0_g5_i1.p1 TRINITY_DN1999_c0_g5~~TRINITY_DN1999_c0_g5_i1.p1  ORF type:complete len:225 (-),score=47.37 TRINITY_DN1999_c0_g5_i1:114-788(-)